MCDINIQCSTSGVNANLIVANFFTSSITHDSKLLDRCMDILDQIVVHSETSTYPVPKLNHTCGMNNDWKDLLIDFSYVPKHWNFLNMHECSMD